MIIDIHSHIMDKSLMDRMGAPYLDSLVDVDSLLEVQNAAGVDLNIISGPRIMEASLKSDMAPIDVVKTYNDFMADLVSRHPKNFQGLGLIDPRGGDEMFREMERGVKELGLRGFLVTSIIENEFIDGIKDFAFFEMCNELDTVVFVHNREDCVGSEYMQENRLIELIGRPNEMTVLAARLVFSGLMGRLPNLKIVLGRLGGAITMYAGRIQQSWSMSGSAAGTESNPDLISQGQVEWGDKRPWGTDNLSGSFLDSLRRMHLDCQTFYPATIAYGVEIMGEDQLLLGTDYPPVPRNPASSIQDVKETGLSKVAQRKLLGENAIRLFKLDDPSNPVYAYDQV